MSGRCVVVTGGAHGIGEACVQTFRGAADEVWILDLEAREGPRSIPANVTDAAQVESAFSRIVDQSGEPAIVVAAAGIGKPASLMETTAEQWADTLAVNLTGVFHVVRTAARWMSAIRRGSIVVIASTNSFDGEADLTAYNSSKAGLLGLVRTAANELGPYGIRVNAVCPGLIRTRLTAAHFSDPGLLKKYFRHIPLGRGGEPAEVASLVAFLGSDQSSFITGAAIPVDGGQMATKFGVWNESKHDFREDRWVLR